LFAQLYRRKVFGEAKDVLWVGYIMVGGEIVIALFFVFFIVVLSERLKVWDYRRGTLLTHLDASIFFCTPFSSASATLGAALLVLPFSTTRHVGATSERFAGHVHVFARVSSKAAYQLSFAALYIS